MSNSFSAYGLANLSLKLFLFQLFWIGTSISIYSQPLFVKEEDDPDFAQFMLQVGFGLETDFNFRTEVPIYLRGYYDFENKPFALELNLIGSVFSERKNFLFRDNLSDNEYQSYSNVEAGFIYNFSTKTSAEQVGVVYDRKSKYSHILDSWFSTEYRVYPTAQVKRRWGLRLGGFRYAQSITDYDAVGKSIEFSDGTTFPDAENAWEEKPTTDDNFFFTAERHFAAYFGIIFQKSFGTILDVKGYGIRNGKSNFFIYLDGFLNIASDVQKLSFQGQLWDLNDATGGVNLNNSGFRLGMKKVGSKVFISAEVGIRPQYLDAKFYSQFLMGYSFNKNH
ncbi:MAG: hypothetical protein MK086_08085 [Flavobacteriales bacterium]|nr:hypothetical protein [Flavobacteriales bacterium]